MSPAVPDQKRLRSRSSNRSKLVRQARRFVVVSGLSAALSFGLPIALVELGGVDHARAVQIGLVAAYLSNLFAIRKYVFGSTNSWRSDVPKYVVANAVFRVVEYLVFEFLFTRLAINYAVALLAVLTASTLLKFFAYRFLFDRPAARSGAVEGSKS